MQVFINIFFTPFMGTYLFMKRKSIEFSFSMKVLSLYAIFCSWNIPTTYVFIYALSFLGFNLGIKSNMYTVVALISSIIVYGAAIIISEFLNISFKVERKDEK